MYHPEVTKRAVSRMSEQMRSPLEYHSSEQIESANRHFKTVWDPEERRILRPLEGDEKRWIRNELTLCQLDFRYWCGNYAMIRDWQKRLVTCKLNLAQIICLDIWGDLENKGRSITCQKLKARQLGMSTITELAVAHRTQFYAGVKSIVASSDPDKSAEMARMMERCWDNQPFFLVPETTGYKKGERIEFGKQDSALSIQHGTQFSGIARGDTPSVAHLSEVCDYTDPEDLIDASLLRCMHESPNLFLVLESTAQGRHNYWHKTWDLSKQGYWEGRSRFCPVFLPWYVGSDIYPTETWIRTRPVPEDWIPAGMTQRHSERAQDYVRSNPILAKHLGADWIMPRKQMWFWEVTRDEYKAKGILNRFFAELCADDLEAFQSTNMSAFDADIISTYRENAGRMPKAVLAITGPSIPVRLQPDRRDIDPRYKPIKIDDDFELIPLRFNGYSGMDPAGKLLVWNFPEDNYEYGLGVDTSDGVGLDRSVIEVIRKGNFYENDVQVAEFANPYVNASDLAPICYAIGKFYSPLNNEGNLKQARIVIECNGNGEAAQHELRKMGWSHFHQWARYDQKKLRIGNSHKIGWFTTGWSRLMMMDYLVKALRDDMIDIQSPYFVDEMSDLDRDENRQSIRASYGGHDDRIMALGMCWFSLHVMELLGPLKSIMRNRLEQQNEAIVYPRYSPGFQAKELAHESPLWDSFDPEDYDLIQDQLPVWHGG